MCVSQKVKFVVFILLIACLRSSAGDGTLELSCTSDENCSSYRDKLVTSSCENSSCKCKDIKTNAVVTCTPKEVAFSNKLGNCPCHIPNANCNLETGKCACNEKFVETNDSRRCIPETAHLDQPCEMNEQCVKYDNNAFCNGGVCHCLENFAKHDNSCRSLVKIGEQCRSDEECRKFTTNVTCFDHKCACEKNFVASTDGNKCLPITFHLENCTQNNQCENGLGPGSVCDSGKCVCDSNHKKIIDNDRIICERQVFHGDTCREHSDCSFHLQVPTMICVQYKCGCRNGYELYDAYSKTCVEVAPSGGMLSRKVLSPAIVFVLFLVAVFAA